MIETYYNDGNVSVELELQGDQIFANLFIKESSPSLFKKIREGLSFLLADASKLGFEYIFLTTRNKNKVKVWETIRPLDDLRYVDGVYLGAWATGE